MVEQLVEVEQLAEPVQQVLVRQQVEPEQVGFMLQLVHS